MRPGLYDAEALTLNYDWASTCESRTNWTINPGDLVAEGRFIAESSVIYDLSNVVLFNCCFDVCILSKVRTNNT